MSELAEFNQIMNDYQLSGHNELVGQNDIYIIYNETRDKYKITPLEANPTSATIQNADFAGRLELIPTKCTLLPAVIFFLRIITRSYHSNLAVIHNNYLFVLRSSLPKICQYQINNRCSLLNIG